MDIGELRTIYSADDSDFQSTTDRVEGRYASTTKKAEQEERKRSAAAESLQRQRSSNLFRLWKEEEREAERSARAQLRTAESLVKSQLRMAEAAASSQARARANVLNFLPGGRQLNEFRETADDIKMLRGEAGAAQGIIAGLGGAGIVAAAGITAVSVGAIAAGVGVFQLARNTADAAGGLYDLSQQTGVSVETLSALGVAAADTGGSLRGVASSLAIYQRNIAAAEEGNKKIGATFRALGIDTSDTERAISSAFLAIGKLPEGYQQTALAQRLFGRSSRDVLAIIKETGGDIDALKRKLSEMGVLISTDTARAADGFNDKLAQVRRQIDGVSRQIGAELLPVVSQGLDDISGWLSENRGSWREWGEGIASSVRTGLDWIGAISEEIRNMPTPKPLDMSNPVNYGRSLYDFLNENNPTRQTMNVINRVEQVQENRAKRQQFDKEHPWTEIPEPRKQGVDPGALGGRSGGRSKEESEATRRARLAVEGARISLREAESIFDQESALNDRSYERNLATLERYNERRKALENDRYKDVKATLSAERAEIQSLSNLKPDERKVKLDDIDQKARDAARQHQEALNRIDAEGIQKRIDSARSLAQARLQTQEADARAFEGQQRALAETGVQTFEETQEKINNAAGALRDTAAAALRANLERALGGIEAGVEAIRPQIEALSGAALRADWSDALAAEDKIIEFIVQAKVNDAPAREVLEGFKQLLARTVDEQTSANEAIQQKRRQDLESAQAYTSQLRGIYSQISDANAEIFQLRIDAQSDNNLQRDETIELQRQLDRAREFARSRVELAELSAARERNALNQNAIERERTEIALNAQIEAARRVSSAKLADIDRRAHQERLQSFREMASDLNDIFAGGLQEVFRGNYRDERRKQQEEFDKTINELRNQAATASADDRARLNQRIEEEERRHADKMKEIGGALKAYYEALLQGISEKLIEIGNEITGAALEKLLTGATQGSDAGGITGAATNAILRKLGLGAKPKQPTLDTSATRPRIVGEQGAAEARQIERAVSDSGRDTQQGLRSIEGSVDRASAEIVAAINRQAEMACQCADRASDDSIANAGRVLQFPTPEARARAPRINPDDLGNPRGVEVLDVERAIRGGVSGQDNLPIHLERASDRITEEIDAARREAREGARETRDSVDRANADISTNIQRSSEHIVNSLTPKPEGFWQGLLKAAVGGAVSGAISGGIGAAAGGGSGGGGRTGVSSSVQLGDTFEGAAAGATRPRIVGARATGGYVSERGLYELAEQGREFVLDANSTQALGGEFLQKLNAIDSKEDAAGLKRDQILGFSKSLAEGRGSGQGGVVNQYYNISVPINAPQGTVSQQTQQQVATTLLRVLKKAERRTG